MSLEIFQTGVFSARALGLCACVRRLAILSLFLDIDIRHSVQDPAEESSDKHRWDHRIPAPVRALGAAIVHEKVALLTDGARITLVAFAAVEPIWTIYVISTLDTFV